MFNKGKYVIIQIILVLISPITSFLVSLRFYKNTISQVFMIVFALYFGMLMGMGNDLSNHYLNMQMYYTHHDIKQILQNPLIYNIGHDYFHVIVKIILSRFAVSPYIFGGVFAAIYAWIFLFFFRQFSRFYEKFVPISCGIIMLAMIMVIQFYWYQGVRFWFGVFFFAGFYMKYVNTGKKINLLYSFGCVFFHFSLYALILATVLNWVLDKFWVYIRFILLGFSFTIRFVNANLLSWFFESIPFFNSIVGESRTSEYTYSSILKHSASYREIANPYYYYRQDVLLISGLLLLMLMWSRKVVFTKQNLTLLFFFMTLYTIANFGYSDISFYTRFYKASLIFFYAFLFVLSFENYEKIKGISLIIIIVALVPLLYEIATVVVEQRNNLLNKELFFGNFFIDWHGGSQKRLI